MTSSAGGGEGRTYLRVGANLFAVYGDELRGWSPSVDDFQRGLATSPWVYDSVEELFFALVNLHTVLCTAPRGDG